MEGIKIKKSKKNKKKKQNKINQTKKESKDNEQGELGVRKKGEHSCLIVLALVFLSFVNFCFFQGRWMCVCFFLDLIFLSDHFKSFFFKPNKSGIYKPQKAKRKKIPQVFKMSLSRIWSLIKKKKVEKKWIWTESNIAQKQRTVQHSTSNCEMEIGKHSQVTNSFFFLTKNQKLNIRPSWNDLHIGHWKRQKKSVRKGYSQKKKKWKIPETLIAWPIVPESSKRWVSVL